MSIIKTIKNWLTKSISDRPNCLARGMTVYFIADNAGIKYVACGTIAAVNKPDISSKSNEILYDIYENETCKRFSHIPARAVYTTATACADALTVYYETH